MRKMTLSLASRLVLRGAVGIVKPADNWVIALRKFDVLRATELTKREEDARKAASMILITCDECGKQTSIESNTTRLDDLPDSPKKVELENAAFEWLVEFKKTHMPWPANQAFVDLHEAIEGAEKVKPEKEKR